MFASYCKLQRDNVAKILACSQGFTRKFSIFGAFERNHSSDKEAALVTVLLNPPRFLLFYSIEHSGVVLRRCTNQNHVE